MPDLPRFCRLALVATWPAMIVASAAARISVDPNGPPRPGPTEPPPVEAEHGLLGPPRIGILIGEDPFRATRRPSPVELRAAPQGALVDTPPAPEPSLRLTGIIWGATPVGVIEGLPGQQGPKVVREGDLVGSIRVQAIRPGEVILAGEDRSWRLKLPSPAWR